MKFQLTLSAFLFFSISTFGQTQTSKDSISRFYEDFFSNIEAQYLYRDKVDWPSIKSHILTQALESKSFEEALDYSSTAFDTIGCNHCQLFTPKYYYSSSLNPQLTQEDFSRNLLIEYEKKTPFKVALLKDQYGYINMPGMLLLDLSQDSLNQVAQNMYDQIVALAKDSSPKGWILDLRFNIGGNVYPMLAALYHLLGDEIMYITLDDNEEVMDIHKLQNGAFYTGDKEEVRIQPSLLPNTSIPVTLIFGKMTSSAGEDVAVGFSSRANVKSIGAETYGFLTSNDMVELPYDIKLALTTGYITNKNKKYNKRLAPDIFIDKKDNFEDPTQDGNIMEAIKFIDSVKQ